MAETDHHAAARVVARLAGRCLARVSVAALLAMAGAGWASGPAEAQRWFEADIGEKQVGKGLEPFEADGPMLAVVSLGRQKITVWDRNGVVASSQVSTGRKGYDTPEGIFSIIERKEEHNSNLYDDASMPFMQRITWSGVALHAGVVPNYRASHGCIRLPEDFAERLFRTAKLNTRVVIVPHDATPMPIAHRALFQAGPAPVATPPAESQSVPALVHPAPALPSGSSDDSDDRPMMLGVAGRLPLPASEPAAVAATPKALPAIADAREALLLRQAAAAKRLAAATKAVNAAKTDVRPRLLELGRTEKALRQVVALSRRAEGRVEAVARQVDTARTPAARGNAEAQHIEALIALAEAKGRQAAAREAATEKAATAAKVQDTVKALEAERVAAQGEHRLISRRLQPVSVLVSRQTGRIYVRQAMQPVLDLPIAIADPERRIGTHIFTALEAKDRRGAVSWVGLTVETPAGGSPVPLAAEPEAPKRRKGQKAEPAPAPKAAPDPLLTARAALDRLQIPDEAMARILPGLQPGATLIISDLGHSIETGPGTDHVIQTRGEEQAAANIAKFVAKKKAEALALVQPVAEPRPSRQRRGDAGFVRSGNWTRW